MVKEIVKKENEEDREIEDRITEEEKQGYHWADGIAEEIIKEKPNSANYTCAAGITPSGNVHIGNFREIITNDFIARALKDKGKNVRFIYSWDDFDRLRKIPSNLPRQDFLQEHIGMPITKVPDTFSCHKSYAKHFERELEAEMPKLGIYPEFIYQAKNYMSCNYADEIKFILEERDKIKAILEKYKTEPVTEEWWPVQIYCEKCMKDTTRIASWDKNYTLEYECKCGYKGKVNFKTKGIVKLPWRIDWPMRWHYEKVDFEPGGKEHSTPGGSRTTAKEIYESLYKSKAPLYMKYDFITIKGQGGKMSKSLGNVIKPKECLEIYEPQIVRYLFAKTRPNTEFAIAFDEDVIKIYTEYDKLEEDYFAKKLQNKEKRIYELSQIKGASSKRIFAPAFRHLIELVQIKSEKEILQFYKKDIKTDADKERTLIRIGLVKNWLKQAPEKFVFNIKENADKESIKKLSKKQISALTQLAKTIEKETSEEEIIAGIKRICEQSGIDAKEFFKAAYIFILGKEEGPKLSSLVIIAREKILKLLKGI